MTKNDQEKQKWEPETWIFKAINWHLLRGFGQSVPAAISMLTPFIGYIVLYHTEIEKYLGGMGGLIDAQTAPNQCVSWLDFSMRLNLVYCGLLLLGIGTIVYRIFAPEAVKEAQSISKFVLNSVDNISARNLRSMYTTIKSRRPETASSFIEIAPWLDRKINLKFANDELRRDEGGQLKIDVLRGYYNVQDRYTKRPVVYVVLTMFVIGFSLLAIPGIAFTSRVLCVVGHDIGVM